MATTPKYDDSHIQTLSSLEHIRKRTGMYIGRTGDGSQYEDGIYILVKEVIDNAVDEFIMMRPLRQYAQCRYCRVASALSALDDVHERHDLRPFRRLADRARQLSGGRLDR